MSFETNSFKCLAFLYTVCILWRGRWMISRTHKRVIYLIWSCYWFRCKFRFRTIYSYIIVLFIFSVNHYFANIAYWYSFVLVAVHSLHDTHPQSGTHAEGVEFGQFSCRGESNVLQGNNNASIRRCRRKWFLKNVWMERSAVCEKYFDRNNDNFRRKKTLLHTAH